MRVALEKVNGVYQGAVFPFREGFMSGVFRQVWGKDGSMYVGQTSRGWGATGRAQYGLQRLVWTGKVAVRAASRERAAGRLRDLLHRAGRPRERGEPRELGGEQLHLQVPPHLRLAARSISSRHAVRAAVVVEGRAERAARRGFAAAGLHPRDPDERREVGERRIAAARLRLLHGEPDPGREGARGEAGGDRDAERRCRRAASARRARPRRAAPARSPAARWRSTRPRCPPSGTARWIRR